MKRSDLLKSIVVANLLVSQFALAADKQDQKQTLPSDASQITDLVEIDSSGVPQHNGACSNGSCK